jgi:hypothetical protein
MNVKRQSAGRRSLRKSLKNRRSLRRNIKRSRSRSRRSVKKSKGIMEQIGGFVRDLSVQAFRTGSGK